MPSQPRARRILGALAFALPLAGCVATRSPRAAPLDCREVPGLDALLAPGVLILGEIHGTEESPAFLTDAVCLGLKAGRRVGIGLEVPIEETARLETFLASAGTASDRAALLDSPFWNADYQDGRRSRAMLSLLEAVRAWRRAGRPVRVGLLDGADLPARPAERDRVMAERLAALHDLEAGGVVVALLGNLHSRVSRGSPWNAGYEAAGFVLARLRPGLRLTSLDVSHSGGAGWFCTSADPASCQERPLGSTSDQAAAPGVSLHPEMRNGHHGVYRVGRVTASPPAARM